MFLAILHFEIKYWLKSRMFYVYLSAYFLIALISMAGAAGAFGEGSSSPDSMANSPMSIYSFNNFFNKLLLFLLPAIVGAAVCKDHKSNFSCILYSCPLSKAGYLLGKFVSGFLMVSVIAFIMEIGLMLGAMAPEAVPGQLLPYDATPYLQTYFIFLIPNLLLFGVVVFSTVLFSRNIYAGFISIILLLLLRETIFRLTGPEGLISLLADPFGESTIQYLTHFLTLTEQNTLPIPSDSIVFYNRLIWMFVTAIIFAATYLRFTFSDHPSPKDLKSKKGRSLTKYIPGSIVRIELVRAKLSYSFVRHIITSWKLSQTDFLFIARSGAFISVAVAGIFLVAAILLQVNPQTDTRVLPLTWVVLGLPVFLFSFLIQIITFLYAGILIHRAKHSRISDLISVTAVPDWVLLLSKLLALVKMQILLLSLIMITGIAIQFGSGFLDIEIGHYLFDLFAIHLIGFIIWAMISLLVQSVFSNTYLSLFILILGALGISQMPSFGIENYLFRFNENPDNGFFLNYSDLNGYGHSIAAHFLYKFYWLLFGLITLCLTLLLWQRELTFSFVERLRLAGKRLSGRLIFVSVILLACLLSFGYYLYQQDNRSENKPASEENVSDLLEQFKKHFEKFEHTKQPRIASVFVRLDFFPESCSFTAIGEYNLINKTEQMIDTILVKSGYDEITTLSFDKEAVLIEEDTAFKFAVYKLDESIDPGDSIGVMFTIRNQENTLLTQNSNVLKNGTFIKSDIFPRLGYFAKTNNRKPDDSTAFSNHYQSIDSDLIDFEAILSTTSGQTAVTSGRLTKEWHEEGRRYFHYKMDKPVKFVLGFNSGEYEVQSEVYKGVDLRIYHHPGHTYCLDRMMEGLKYSLDYNTKHFGAYQHEQAYIIEFPRSEGTYATTSGNRIQVSEMRFIIDTNRVGKGGTDLSFYVPAHELTHQWWGNQVIPADALGATMITESIAEYVSAKVYEKKYGRQGALKFLEIQRNRYLSGRAGEAEEEAPLYLVGPEQAYISYGKGAIALYTLSEFIGEENLNAALKEYLNYAGSRQPPYTTSLEMLGFLRKATPDSLQYLITDMFFNSGKEKLLQHFDKIIGRDNSDR